MKVLQLCSFYTGNSMYNKLFDKLQAEDVSCTIYAPCKNKHIGNNKGSHEVVYDPVFKNGDSLIEKLSNVFNQYEFYRHGERVFKSLKEKIDIDKYEMVHAHSLYSDGYLAYRLYKEFGKKYIVAVRSTDINGYMKRAVHLRKIGIRIMKHAEKVVFISPGYKKSMIETYVKSKEYYNIIEKAIVIPNGIDDFWHEKSRKTIPNTWNGKSLKLIQVSRIDKNKNIETSIKVCEELVKKGYDAKLTVVGEGPLLRRLKKKYNHTSSVDFVGKHPKEELLDIYDQNDIFIMPSRFETFGLVYAEAMSRGLPVIYTKGQGFDRYFDNGIVGYPIKYDRVDDGVLAVEQILENYQNISVNCINYSRIFEWRTISKMYRKVYGE